MAKRARLTTEEVLENWESIDTTEAEDWEGLDGAREPVTPGSDDEFSDLEENLCLLQTLGMGTHGLLQVLFTLSTHSPHTSDQLPPSLTVLWTRFSSPSLPTS